MTPVPRGHVYPCVRHFFWGGGGLLSLVVLTCKARQVSKGAVRSPNCFVKESRFLRSPSSFQATQPGDQASKLALQLPLTLTSEELRGPTLTRFTQSLLVDTDTNAVPATGKLGRCCVPGAQMHCGKLLTRPSQPTRQRKSLFRAIPERKAFLVLPVPET